ncbi:MAG: hypothetical protein Q8L10_02145 [Candidatus Moranbacteria bacterium]|nr:hypothetical protein [Candidatus Moranbacteria bacterium]
MEARITAVWDDCLLKAVPGDIFEGFPDNGKLTKIDTYLGISEFVEEFFEGAFQDSKNGGKLKKALHCFFMATLDAGYHELLKNGMVIIDLPGICLIRLECLGTIDENRIIELRFLKDAKLHEKYTEHFREKYEMIRPAKEIVVAIDCDQDGQINISQIMASMRLFPKMFFEPAKVDEQIAKAFVARGKLMHIGHYNGFAIEAGLWIPACAEGIWTSESEAEAKNMIKGVAAFCGPQGSKFKIRLAPSQSFSYVDPQFHQNMILYAQMLKLSLALS